ncbi:MAG: type II toxin-antitoxin system RelE/ParE family toxin [Desulfofustis sp. PB-SRB1]|nr:type II toxin-antitoxin system RelE/ParE family toxin [Desulfofustis sp. PB-SRB1]
MKKLCTKWFARWAKNQNLSNNSLLEAIENLENRLSAIELGGSLYKVRVKRVGKGKSTGFRTIVLYKKKDRAIFLYGFGKNEKSNINTTELLYFKKFGSGPISA